MKQVIKRNGKKVKFDKEKIINAIEKAFLEVDGEVIDKSHQKAKEIAGYIESQDKNLSVEEINVRMHRKQRIDLCACGK